jgi:hypothetical protein
MLTSMGAAERLTASHILAASFPTSGSSAEAFAPSPRTIHVIPQNSEPRWIILGDPLKALPVLRSWRPWNLRSRLRWSGMLLAVSVKVLPRLPGVVSSGASIDLSYWQRNLPGFTSSWTAVIHLGSPSHTRKAIVFFLGDDQLIKAVAKVPLTLLAADAILNEASILQQMRAIEVLPKMQFQDSDRGVASQSWLDGRPVSRAFTSAHVDLLSLLAIQGASTRVSDYQAEMAARLDKYDLPFDRSLLARALEMLNFDQPLQGFVEHRDFAPWNLKRLANGSLGLLDWEWAVPMSLPWQDACRFFYVQDALFNGHENVWETLTRHPFLQRYRDRFAISPDALPALTMHYLLRVLCMDWQSGNTRLAHYTFAQIGLLVNIHRGIPLKF